MGLDMYAKRTRAPISAVDFKMNDEFYEQTEELHYWRKHPNLHGWMYELYRERGGKDEDFNVSPVQITSADLDRLEHDIKANNLPRTSGFFFGETDGSEWKDDLDFVAKARQSINDGFNVFYYAWW